MLFENHYCKVSGGVKNLTVLESEVYAALPANRIFTMSDIVRFCLENKDAPNSEKVITNTLKVLITKKAVVTVVGIHLQRFVEERFIL